MANKIIKTTFQFRRDTTANWTLNKDVVPAAGEPCFDTELKTLKIGDGTTRYADLPFDFGNLIWHGHFNAEGQFIYNEEGLSAEPSVNAVYIDTVTYGIYCYDGEKYIKLNSIPTASSTDSGVMKLYSTTGQNTDGTMTQKAITDELNKKVSDWQVVEEETLSLTWE